MNRKIQRDPLLISDHILTGCTEAANELGIDLAPVLAEHGIEERRISAPQGFLAGTQVIDFLQGVADRYDCQHFGLLVGKYQPPLRFGAAAMLLTLTATLQEALGNAVRYHEVYANSSIWSLVLDENWAAFRRRDSVVHAAPPYQLRSLGIVQATHMMSALCGSRWRPMQVCLTQPAQQIKRNATAFLRCAVAFDQPFDEVVFTLDDLERPISTANSQVLSIIKTHFDRRVGDDHAGRLIEDRVSNFIREKIGNAACNLASCAQQLRIPRRTLQRQLAARHTSFQALLHEARMDLARQCLQNPRLSLSELAQALGYRNLSTFSRTFKREHGVPPRQWRAGSRGALDQPGSSTRPEASIG